MKTENKTDDYYGIESIQCERDYLLVVDKLAESALENHTEMVDRDESDFQHAIDTACDCQWTIYSRHHYPILRHASNPETYLQEFGMTFESDALWSDIVGAFAYHALRADVSDKAYEHARDRGVATR
jgi:hypothetical protein